MKLQLTEQQMMNNAALILKQLSVTNLTGNLINETDHLVRPEAGQKLKPKEIGRNYSLDSPVVYTTSSLDQKSSKRQKGRLGYETFLQPSQTLMIP